MLNLDRKLWSRVRFGDVTTNVNERVDDPSSAGVERYVGLEHLDPGSMTVNRWGSPGDVAATKLLFEPGDVIFGRRRAYQKKVARADFKGICSAHAMVLRAKPEHIDPNFLPVFLSSESFLDRAVKISVGSLSPTVNWKTLAAQEFDLPPLDQQRRIADLLWGFESHSRSVFRLHQDAIDASLAYFSQRLAESKAAPRAVRDIVSEAPRNGLSVAPSGDETGTPTISLAAIRDGRLRSKGAIKYVNVDAKRVAPFTIRPDDFLVVRGNGNRDLVGRGAHVREGDVPPGCFYPDLLIRVRFNPEKVLPSFAARQWNSPEAHDRLLLVAKTTSGIYKVNGQDIRSHNLLVPPLSEQHDIMDKVARIDAAAESAHDELSRLIGVAAALRDSILGDPR